MGNNNSAESKEDQAIMDRIREETKTIKDIFKKIMDNVVESSSVVSVYSRYLDKFTQDVNMKTMDEYNITYNEAMIKLFSLVDLVIFKEIMTDNSLKRNCDIIFAIQSKFTELVLCKIFIGGQFIHELTLLPGAVQWILNGCPITFTSLAYHEVKIELYNVITNDKINIDNNIYIYKMNLQHNLRRDLVCKTSSCDISDEYNLLYASGMANIDRTKQCKGIHHFERRLPIDYIQRKTEEFIKIIKEELIAKTWHPLRYMQWCLDETEKEELRLDGL
jgi:hypothetical protein